MRARMSVNDPKQTSTGCYSYGTLRVDVSVTSRAQRADPSAMYFACLAMLLIPSRRRNATKVSYVDGCILR